MRLLRLVLPIAILSLALSGQAADADDAPAEGAKAPAKVIWLYEKGGTSRGLDVTHMDPAVRAALDVQMRDQGWVRAQVAPKDARPKPAPKAAPKAVPKAAPQAGRTPKDVESDIAELIRRGGKLPKGWRPAGEGPGPFGSTEFGSPPRIVLDDDYSSALARLVLAYLRVEKDPVKGPLYRSVLRRLAQQTLDGQDARPLFAERSLGHELLRGAEGDPTTAPIYAEILKILGREAAPLVAPPAPKPPFEGPFAGVPTSLGGASVGYGINAGVRGVRWLALRSVPKNSTAHAAGLRAGDRIVRIDGKPVDAAGMRRAVKAFEEGGQLTLDVVRRNDKRETLNLLLEKE